MGLADDLRIIENLSRERNALEAQIATIDEEYAALRKVLVSRFGKNILDEINRIDDSIDQEEGIDVPV